MKPRLLNLWQAAKDGAWILWLGLAIVLIKISGCVPLCHDKTYWPNGQLHTKMQVDCFWVGLGDGAPTDGSSEEWDQDGNLIYKGYFDSSPNATVRHSVSWASGPQTWYGPCDNSLQRWFWHGRVLDHWVWHNNKPVDGKRIAIWTDGKLRAETNYLDGKLNGRVASWADNGQILSDEQYVMGQPVDGPVMKYFSDGKISLKAARVGGLWDGPYVEYYENGILKTEGSFKLGIKDGEYREWNESGVLIDDENWRGGKLDGKQTYVSNYKNVSYYSGGNLTCSIDYWPNGRIKHSTNFDSEGKENGTESDYFKNGTLRWTSKFVHGHQLAKTYKEWDANGDVVGKP